MVARVSGTRPAGTRTGRAPGSRDAVAVRTGAYVVLRPRPPDPRRLNPSGSGSGGAPAAVAKPPAVEAARCDGFVRSRPGATAPWSASAG